MAGEPVRGVTPVGRLIWGSVSEKQRTNYDGKPYEAGKEPFQFGLAIRKDDPGLMGFLQSLFQAATSSYSNNQAIMSKIQNEWQSGFTINQFKFKIRDGDKPDDKGQMRPNSQGCFVFNFGTHLQAVKCCNRENVEIDPKTIETGYFVDIAYSANGNGLMDSNAGIFLNPNVVRLIAFGDKIVGGISPEQAFAGHAAPSQLPPGASLTPVAPQGGAMPGFGAAPQQQAPQGGAMPGFGAAPQQQAPQQPYGANPQLPVQQPYGGQGFVQNAAGQPMNTGYAAPQPEQGAYPSSGMPAGFPQGAPQQPTNGGYPTGYPINPQTGQPVMPHQTFLGQQSQR